MASILSTEERFFGSDSAGRQAKVHRLPACVLFIRVSPDAESGRDSFRVRMGDTEKEHRLPACVPHPRFHFENIAAEIVTLE